MRALVTGASGCLGRALVEELGAEGWTVRATARAPAALPDFRSADLSRDRLRPLLEDVDAVFHCAALSSAWGAPADFEAANVIATRRLLDAARAAGASRFVFASTPSLYADGGDRLNLTEDAPLARRSMTTYAETKRRAEAMVLAADGPAMRCTAIRPRAIYGAYDRSLLPRLRAALARGRMPVIGGGRALIDLTHRRDAARAMRLAAGGPGGRVWNVTSGEAFAFRDLARMTARRAGVAFRPVSLPYRAALALAAALEAAARLRDGGEPPLTRQAVVSLGRSLTLDISAAERDLGYRPAVALEEGLSECFA